MSVAGWLALSAASSPPLVRLGILIRADDRRAESDLEMVESKLAGSIAGTGRFAIFNRTELSAIIREQGLSNSAYADPATAAKLGKLAGVAQMFIGSLHENETEQPGGFLLKRTVEVALDYQLIDVSTGRVYKADSLSGLSESRAPNGGPYTETLLSSRQTAAGNLAASVSQALATP
jgi:curli biogenesis system outer membrane secretion channel CsgG